MNKIKKILIATDLSPLSFSALEKGLEIAKNCNAKVTILHILEKGVFDELKKNVLSPARKELIKPREYAEQLIKEKINKLIQKNIKIDILILSTKIKPAIKIISHAKKIKTDLIVLGAHGRYTFHDWFVGTTAEYIVKKTQCPVLIIKNTKKTPYKKILLPIDFSSASKAPINFGYHLFPNSHFYVLNVGDQAYDELVKSERMQTYGKGQRLRHEIMLLLMNKAKQFIFDLVNKKKNFSFKIKLGYAGLVILEEAKKTGMNLVIMGIRGHDPHYYKWLGSVASRVLIEVDNDILLVPSNKIKRSKKIVGQKDTYLKKVAALTEEHFQQLKGLAKS